MPTIASTTDLCKLLGDPTRLRLLSLLRDEELTVAELVATTELPQPRVSTHLGRLKEASLVADRRSGSSAWYRLHPRALENPTVAAVLASADDPLLARDARRMRDVVDARGGTWADAVAGTMERHYSPGRTWESLARAFGGTLRGDRVLDLGSGDGAVARMLAPYAERVVCVDLSERVLERGREQALDNMRFLQADLHDLPLDEGSFDLVLLLTSLVYARDPAQALREAARVLAPGGRLVATVLRQHGHTDAVAPYDHVHLGFSAEVLATWTSAAGLSLRTCAVTSREKRAPYFEILTLTADKP